jgi:hypothetical protein
MHYGCESAIDDKFIDDMYAPGFQILLKLSIVGK